MASQSSGETRFRLFRYHGGGAADRTEIAVLELPAEDAAELNKALVRTAYRLLPPKKE